MNKYEELEQRANDSGVPVVPYDFTGTRLKGLYCDGTVAIDKDLDTTAERACVLAEELGHHITTVGDITDLKNAESRKQELKARMWAYNHQIGLTGLIKATLHGCRNSHEAAEYLEVTEEFLQDCIDCYRKKYGRYAVVDNYIVYLDPTIGVMEMTSSNA